MLVARAWYERGKKNIKKHLQIAMTFKVIEQILNLRAAGVQSKIICCTRADLKIYLYYMYIVYTIRGICCRKKGIIHFVLIFFLHVCIFICHMCMYVAKTRPGTHPENVCFCEIYVEAKRSKENTKMNFKILYIL